jgi:serine/threonine protein kinase
MKFQGRFRGEISRIRQVPPFCTAAVLDADPDHDPPYLVVQFVDGPSLTHRMTDQGPLGTAELHSVALGIATALAAIHGAGVVHRDLKPDNVLFALGGVKVIDFGIARGLEVTSAHTRTGQMVGTIAYMAPERFEADSGARADPASDVFAWAATVTYAATGRTPFVADSTHATAVRILTQPPDLTGVPESLRDLLERALEKDPRLRPTARELLDLLLPRSRPADVASAVARIGPATHRVELQNFVNEQVRPLRATSHKLRRPRRVGWAAIGSAVLVLAAGATAAYFHGKGEPRTDGKLAATASIPSTSPSTPGTAARRGGVRPAAPKPTGLVGPWDPASDNSQNPIANNFLVSVAFGSRHKVGTSGCLDGFCYLWTGDGRTRIDVVSYDRLPDREALRLLKGIKLASMDDPGAWFDANTALQAGR